MNIAEGWNMYLDIQDLKSMHFNVSQISRRLDLSRTTVYRYLSISPEEMGQLIIVENERTLPNLDYNQNGVRRIIFTGIVGEDQCGFLHDCKFDIPQSPKE